MTLLDADVSFSVQDQFAGKCFVTKKCQFGPMCLIGLHHHVGGCGGSADPVCDLLNFDTQEMTFL